MFGYSDLLGPIEKIIQLTQLFPENLANRLKFSVRLDSLDDIKSDRPKKFFHGTLTFFIKILFFEQPVRCYRNDLLICTKGAKLHGGT